LLLGFLIAVPLGAIVVMPSERTSERAPVRWEVSRGLTASVGAEPSAVAPTPTEILAQVAGGAQPSTPRPAAAAPAAAPPEDAGLVTEAGELEYTQPLAGFIPGNPPSAELAATLRRAQQRFAPQQATPQSADPSARAIALTRNPRVTFTRQSQITDLSSGMVDPRVVDVLIWISGRRNITITSMRSDHSVCVSGSNPCRVSAHNRGRAVDIAAVNGEACGGTPSGQCGQLYEEIVNTLRGTEYQPSQIIYGYDPWPSERWNFEMGNHHDHIHIGF
jgi:hypothetical protein